MAYVIYVTVLIGIIPFSAINHKLWKW